MRGAPLQVTVFGNQPGVLVCSPGRSLRPWFSVPEGCYALVQRFGRDEDYAEGKPVWPAGFHWGPPWLKVENLITKQSVVFNMPVKGCKTADNVTVQINLAIVFRIMADEDRGEDPENAKLFVYRVGPRGLEQQLMDACGRMGDTSGHRPPLHTPFPLWALLGRAPPCAAAQFAPPPPPLPLLFWDAARCEEATRSVARSLQHQEVYGLRTDRSGKGAKVCCLPPRTSLLAPHPPPHAAHAPRLRRDRAPIHGAVLNVRAPNGIS